MMGPELDTKPKSEASMKVSLHDGNGSIHQNPEDNLIMPCTSNCKENMFDMEALSIGQTTAANGSENEVLNITDPVNPSNFGLVEIDCQDATENSQSSSFTRTEDYSVMDIDDVDSRFCGGNASLFEFDQYGDAFRMR